MEEASGNSAENPEPVDAAEEPTEEPSLGKITGGVVSFVTGKINKKVYSLGALIAFIMILIVMLYYVMRSGKEPLEEGKNKNPDKKQKKSSKEDYI